MNKLFDLIASQHTSNTESNAPKNARLITAVRKNHLNLADDISNTNVNRQLLNELRGELKSVVESQIDNSTFTEKNYKLISIVTKLSFLVCIDFITLFVYFIFAEIYTMLLDNNTKIYMTFLYIMFIIQPFSWLIFHNVKTKSILSLLTFAST